MTCAAEYRFMPGIGWASHLWKATIRQDHAHLRSLLAGMLPPDGVAVDVGAHGGQVTRLLAGLAPRGVVVAVEPSGYARSVLRPALWARRVRNAVVFAGALGEREGVARLVTPIKRGGDMGYGLGRIARGPAPAGAGTVSETVPVTTLDRLVDCLGLERLDFVKVDIEGHEAAFVEGAAATLGRFRPALMLEHDPVRIARAGGDAAAMWARLEGLGYRAHEAHGCRLEAIAGAPARPDVFWMPGPVT